MADPPHDPADEAAFFSVTDREAERALASIVPMAGLLTGRMAAESGAQPRRAASACPPLSIDASLTAIHVAEDRDRILELACRALNTVARCAAFFVYREGALWGQAACGGPMDLQFVRSLWIPLRDASVLHDAAVKGQSYCGPPGQGAADVLLRAALGGRNGDWGLQPICLKGRVVGLLWADGLERGPLGRERLTAIATSVAEALERILLARRLG